MLKSLQVLNYQIRKVREQLIIQIHLLSPGSFWNTLTFELTNPEHYESLVAFTLILMNQAPQPNKPEKPRTQFYVLLDHLNALILSGQLIEFNPEDFQNGEFI